MSTISSDFASLWAKKNNTDGMSWLPLAVHMADCAGVARQLWRSWLPTGVKQSISKLLRWSDETNPDPEQKQTQAGQALIFIAAIHDLGKATPVFQAKTRNRGFPDALDAVLLENQLQAGLVMPLDSYKMSFPNAGKSPHALATQLLLEKFGCSRHFAAILGSHHGKPANSMMLFSQKIESYSKNYGFNSSGREGWEAVQREALQYALNLSGFSSLSQLPKPDMEAQVLLSGLAIMADWIASKGTQGTHHRVSLMIPCFSDRLGVRSPLADHTQFSVFAVHPSGGASRAQPKRFTPIHSRTVRTQPTDKRSVCPGDQSAAEGVEGVVGVEGVDNTAGGR